MPHFFLKTFYALAVTAGVASPFVIPPGCHASSRSDDGRYNPEPPRLFVDTRPVPPTGREIDVPAGGNFQAALQGAKPGDLIVLQAGAVYRGPFVLPRKTGDGWITIQSSAAAGALPGAGTRVSPTDAAAMPALESGSEAVIRNADGAN